MRMNFKQDKLLCVYIIISIIFYCGKANSEININIGSTPVTNNWNASDKHDAYILMSNLASNVSSEYGDYSESGCSLEMFGEDSNAYWACVTLYAIQTNWFPSPVAGLYIRQYLDWNGFDGFWQNGYILEALANYNHYTGSKRFWNILVDSWRSMDRLFHAYEPFPSFDDEGWFALVFARLYEVTGNHTFLDTSMKMYDYLWQNGWDFTMTCNGGVYFGGGHHKKISITNGQLLQLGAKLYRFLQQPQYLNNSLQIYDFMVKSLLNQTNYLVADSIDIYSCERLPYFNITYNSGMFIGGLVELYRATTDQKFLSLAHKIAHGNIEFSSHNGIFQEYCDWDNQCINDDNGKIFKGVFVRNLRYLMDVSDDQERAYYQNFLQQNINAALKNAQCLDNAANCNVDFPDGNSTAVFPPVGPFFTARWSGPFNFSNVITQTPALDLFIAATDPSTSCNSPDNSANHKGCYWDPGVPDIRPLTCADNPCRGNNDCCTWINIYATCCMDYQTCQKGGCYPP